MSTGLMATTSASATARLSSSTSEVSDSLVADQVTDPGVGIGEPYRHQDEAVVDEDPDHAARRHGEHPVQGMAAGAR